MIRLLIVLCMLCVGARPAEPQRVLDERESKLVPTHARAQPPLARRSCVPDGHVRPPLFVPAVIATPVPRTAIVIDTQLAPALRFALFVHSGSSRGPPQA